MKLLFLNGFDRSGSSMIGGLLSRHPEVAYFFQPFNRTEIHATQYEIWKPGQSFPATEKFLEGLLAGRVAREHLGTDLFDRHSTSREPQARMLNLVKETKLHFKARWMRARFPEIELRGIWRDPRGIVCSLLRNGFASDWYGARAFDSISRTIHRWPELACYESFLARELEDFEKLAIVVAARTHVFCASVEPDHWLVYEEVLTDCDRVLNGLVSSFGLATYDFARHLGEDFNVVGKPTEGPDLWRSYFSAGELEGLDEIFAPLAQIGPASVRNELAG